MTYFDETLSTDRRKGAVASAFASVAAFFDRVVAFQTRDIAVRALQAKSDDELAEMGLARNDIVRHVYRDIYYV